jgi:zinc transporter, ZIP family
VGDGRRPLLLISAFAWGAFASSSLLVGAIAALNLKLSARVVGLVMGFGAGVLISAVAFELFAQAAETTHRHSDVAGIFAGSLTFYVGDRFIDRKGGEGRKRMRGGGQEAGVALAIVLGIVLDGIPESTVIGLDLHAGEGVSVAFLVAVFLSNLPEAAGASTGLASSGWSSRAIYTLWVAVSLVAGLASAVGYAIAEASGAEVYAFILAFAAGAILTMLADTMMPEAFTHGGKAVGLLTTLGFALSFAISSLE